MTNIEILENIGVLEDIQNRLHISSDEVNDLSPEECVEAWAGWNLGDESWATEIIRIYEILKEKDIK